MEQSTGMDLLAPPEERARLRLNRWALAAALGVFAMLSFSAAVASKGFLEADAVMHYLGARQSIHDPFKRWDVWGRPVVTAIYALPAYFSGVVATRATALLLAVVAAMATFRVARSLGYRWPALAAIALCAQPLFFLHSFAELTEMPFAAILILAFWAYHARRFWAMAMLVGLLPLTRPEGFGFGLLAAAALIAHRRPQWLALLVAPFLVWNYKGWEAWNFPDYGHGWFNWLRWVSHHWPYAADSVYGRGPLWSFAVRMPVVTAPFFFPFFCIGLALPWIGLRLCDLDHRRRCQLLIGILPMLIFVVHSLLWWQGKQGSNGELRYLLIVGPFWALLSAAGWEWTFDRLKWQGVLRWAGVAALAPMLANIVHPVVPLPAYEDDDLAHAFLNWYRGDEAIRTNFPRIMASPVKVHLYLDERPGGAIRTRYWLRSNVQRNADPATRAEVAGTILVWDESATKNASQAAVVPRQLIEDSGWIHVGQFKSPHMSFEVYLSSLTADGQSTDELLSRLGKLGTRQVAAH